MKRNVPDSATAVEDVLDLRAFCLVSDLRSITKAARLLRESKATVSRRITRLELALGVALLERTPRLVQPTDDGAAYRLRVGEVLELLGAANDGARQARAAPAGLLRVTSGPEFNSVLAPVLVAFGERYPDVRVEMVVTQQALDLDAERIDVALRVAGQLADSSLIAHKLFDIELAVIASPAYLARHRAPRTPEDLARHRTIFLRGARSRPFPIQQRATGKLVNVPTTPTWPVTDMNLVIELARAHAGIGFVPKVSVQRELDAGVLVQVLKDHEISGAALFLLHRSGRFLSPKLLAFRDFVLEALGPKHRKNARPRAISREE